MDPVMLGRWIADRRRAGGWRSQRALAESVRRDPIHHESDISEDFLARLEAGQLAYPLRPAIRRRVLTLAWLLCQTPDELRTYLRAAELTDLDAEEEQHVHRLTRYVTALASPPRALLPPRPARLFGRDAEVRALVQALSGVETGVCAVSGMPGIGKSAVANEAVHVVAGDERVRVRLFPDGVATFTCTGRRGVDGLISLLQDVTSAMGAASMPSRTHAPRGAGPTASRRGPNGRDARPTGVSANTSAGASAGQSAALAAVMDEARLALADTSALLFLDDVHPEFPVRQAIEVLLSGHQDAGVGRDAEPGRRVVLTTSRHLPPPSLLAFHLHLHPLDPQAARDLLSHLIGSAPDAHEGRSIAQICVALGHLPLALEAAAAAIQQAGVPPALLARRLAEDAMGATLDIDGELRTRLTDAMTALAAEPRRQLALLAQLGIPELTLEAAAAIQAASTGEVGNGGEHDPQGQVEGTSPSPPHAGPESTVPMAAEALMAALTETLSGRESEGDDETGADEVRSALLARTAAEMGQLVLHSLVEVTHDPLPDSAPDTASPAGSTSAPPGPLAPASGAANPILDSRPRYILHPIVRSFVARQVTEHAGGQASDDASRLVPALDPEALDGVRERAWEYALRYSEEHFGEASQLARERGFLLAMVAQAHRQQRHEYTEQLLERLVVYPGLLGTVGAAERATRWGIEAARQQGDWLEVAPLLDHLGLFHYFRGAFAQARRVWEDSIQLAEALQESHRTLPANLWDPLANLAMLATKAGEHDAARHLLDRYLHYAHAGNNCWIVALALHERGISALAAGNKQEAYDALSACLSVAKAARPGKPGLLALRTLAERARLEGDAAHARQFSEAAIAMAQSRYNPYDATALLVDQASYAQQHGDVEAARQLVRQAAQLAAQLGVDYVSIHGGRIARLLTNRRPGSDISA
jgi:tetratricopeptide (TPR) repeat protein